MKHLNAGLAIALAAVITIFSSCETSQQLVSPTTARNTHKDPKFLNDISLTAGNSNEVSMSIVNRAAKATQQVIPILNELQMKYGGMLGVGPQAITNLPLYSFIEDWYGTRYRYGGDDKDGIDCSAFVQRIYEHVFCTSVVRTAMAQFQDCTSLLQDVTKLREGDLVFFRTRGKRISHVGVYLANNFFVHASSSNGVMISNLEDTYWQRTFAGGGQLPKQEIASL